MSYTNNDGLTLKFGTDKAVTNKGGQFHSWGSANVLEVEIDLTALGTAAAIVSDQIYFPKGARIEKVEVVTKTAATGSGAVLNVGLVRSSDRTTAIDADGFVAALPLASVDAAGETTVLTVGSTYAGSSIGTTTATYVGMITADYDTAAFTAGVVTVRIFYRAL